MLNFNMKKIIFEKYKLYLKENLTLRWQVSEFHERINFHEGTKLQENTFAQRRFI